MTAAANVLLLPEQPAIALNPADEQWVVDPPRGAWKAKLRRFAHALRDPAVYIPGAVLVFIILACFFGPLLFSMPSRLWANAIASTGGCASTPENG